MKTAPASPSLSGRVALTPRVQLTDAESVRRQQENAVLTEVTGVKEDLVQALLNLRRIIASNLDHLQDSNGSCAGGIVQGDGSTIDRLAERHDALLDRLRNIRELAHYEALELHGNTSDARD